MIFAKAVNQSVRRHRRSAGSKRARHRLGIESLEQRLALAITLPIQDLTGLAPDGYDIWVTGHGIPGWQAAGAPPLYLMSLDSSGSFAQTAFAIASATSSGTTATITTQSPHGLQSSDTVFIAGVNVAGYNGSFVVGGISAATPNVFTITTAGSDLAPSSPNTGTVYEDSLVKTTNLLSAASVSFDVHTQTGLAQLTTLVPHGLSVGQTIQIAGVSEAGYDGVFSVSQVPSSTTFQVTYAAASALPAGTGGHLRSVALEPVKLSQLPSAQITLGNEITNISSKILFFVAEVGITPDGLPFGGNGVTPTDPPTPPYNPSSLAPTSVFDIVEFAYLPWGATSNGTVATITTTQPHGLAVSDPVTITGVVDAAGSLITGYNIAATVTSVVSPMAFTYTVATADLPPGGSGTVNGSISISSGFSTFDLSAVDGLAIPMRLEASTVKAGAIDSVGIRPGSGFTRQAIGEAFLEFMANDPLGHPNIHNPAARDFAKLLYQAGVKGTAIADVSASWSSNAATFTYTSSSPILQFEWVEISGYTGSNAGYNGTYQVQNATATTFTVTNTDSSLTAATGGTVTPVLFEAPPILDDQFFAITAPKDWLANQQPSATQVPPGLASQDPLATFWDGTIENFFESGNHLSIYLGKEPGHPIYSGSSDGTKYTLTNGLNTYDFAKPTGGSLANATYVWAQQNAPAGDEGLLQDQIWQALCRGVALDGVSKSAITSGESSTAWASTTDWYTQHASTAFPAFQSVYCPYSKFLHYSTLEGGVDRTGTSSIFLHTAAYGFSEDENPIANPAYSGLQVPSKLDGTVLDGTTSVPSSVTISLVAWGSPSLGLVSGDFDGNGLTDIAELKTTGQWEAALTPTSGSPTTVNVGSPWATNVSWSDFTVIRDTTTNRDVVIARASSGGSGSWWKLSLDGATWNTTFVGSWGIPDQWVDIVAGDFDGDGTQDIAGRWQEMGQWWMLADATAATTIIDYASKNVAIGQWNPSVTWSEVVAGNFTGDAGGKDTIAGLTGPSWWLLERTGSSSTNTLMTSGWSTAHTWSDYQVGNFTGAANGQEQIAARSTSSGAWHLLEQSGASFIITSMQSWNPAATWLNVVAGDFDGSGMTAIAGRNAATGAWTVLGKRGGTFTNADFGGAWPTSSVWGKVFAGIYDEQTVSPKTFGILGRTATGATGTWEKALSSGTAFTSSPAPGYPA